jgi:putative hydrolase of the HAD superfamily
MFDLDETLFDRTSSLRTFAVQQLSGSQIGELSDPNALADRFLALDQRGRVAKDLVYRSLLAEIGHQNEELAEELFNDYEANAWRFARPFVTMEETLRGLRASGKKIAIVSNGQTQIQLRTLLALNLDRLADVYLISEQEGCRKPETTIFLRAAKKLAVDTADCVFVGDSPEADLLGARSVGMRTVWFPNGAVWPQDFMWQPDATITALSELQDLMDAWDEE